MYKMFTNSPFKTRIAALLKSLRVILIFLISSQNVAELFANNSVPGTAPSCWFSLGDIPSHLSLAWLLCEMRMFAGNFSQIVPDLHFLCLTLPSLSSGLGPASGQRAVGTVPGTRLVVMEAGDGGRGAPYCAVLWDTMETLCRKSVCSLV